MFRYFEACKSFDVLRNTDEFHVHAGEHDITVTMEYIQASSNFFRWSVLEDDVKEKLLDFIIGEARPQAHFLQDDSKGEYGDCYARQPYIRWPFRVLVQVRAEDIENRIWIGVGDGLRGLGRVKELFCCWAHGVLLSKVLFPHVYFVVPYLYVCLLSNA